MIPWILSDSNFVKQPSQRLDPQKTVFVGALHGMLNAEGLAHILNDLFGHVVYAGIDTDKHKYPIGKQSVSIATKLSCRNADRRICRRDARVDGLCNSYLLLISIVAGIKSEEE